MKIIISTAFLLLIEAASQAQYIQNGTLLGPIGAQPPDYWYSCHEWADPDIMQVFIPNNGDPAIYPTDGTTLLLMRARGVHYDGRHPIRSREYMSQELINPLLQHNCYTFKADLCYSPWANINDTEDPNVSYPLTLQAWGAHKNCSTTTLLFESDPVNNIEWQEFSFDILVENDDYTHLFLQVNWDTVNIKGEAYNGIILLDNLRLEWSGASDTTAEHDVYYYADREVVLHAQEGLTYLWDPQENLNAYDIQSPTLTSYREQFSVVITQESGCPVKEIFHIIIDCDSLYSENVTRDHTVFYKFESPIYLVAAEGVSYDWNPKMNLNAYDIRSPYLTDYQDVYYVTVYDRFGCALNEEFNIILDCDTLYPEGNYIVLDTLIESESPVDLIPLYGEIAGYWIPQNYLSCADCRNTIASPVYSISYSVLLSDEFSCEHTEIFVLNVNLKIPNVITPNRDGYNEFFKIYGLPDNSTLTIFDKSGQIIFRVNPYDSGHWWRGTNNKGDPVDSGTYWYAIELGDTGEVIKGFVFVIR